MGVDGLCVLTLFSACPTRDIVIKCNIANKLLFFHRNMKRSLPSPTKPSNTNSPTRSPARKIAASTKPNNSNVATYTLTADECANLAATIDLFQSIGVDGEVNDEEVSAIAAVAPADDVKPIPEPPLELAIGDEVKYYEYPYTFGDTRGLRIQRVKNIEVAYHKEWCSEDPEDCRYLVVTLGNNITLTWYQSVLRVRNGKDYGRFMKLDEGISVVERTNFTPINNSYADGIGQCYRDIQNTANSLGLATHHLPHGRLGSQTPVSLEQTIVNTPTRVSMPHGSSDHIPVYPTVGDSNSISPAVPVNEVCKIQVGLVFKTPSELFDAVEQAFLSTGMPASHFIRKPKGSFNDEEQLQHFGSIFRRNGEVVPCPVRGAFRCKKTGKQGGCPWYVQFGHYIKHSGYLITVSCTEHNHPVSEPTIDGYTEIKYEKDPLKRPIVLGFPLLKKI